MSLAKIRGKEKQSKKKVDKFCVIKNSICSYFLFNILEESIFLKNLALVVHCMPTHVLFSLLRRFASFLIVGVLTEDIDH